MTKWNYLKIINHNHYFTQKPSYEFITSFLEFVFGIKQWDVLKTFNKKDNIDIPNKMIEMIPFLTIYIKNYLINHLFYNTTLTFNKCITILHHFVLCYGYNIRFETKIENYTYKYNIYSIYRLDDLPINGIKIRKHVWLHFDCT
jgi:hypothetical protein